MDSERITVSYDLYVLNADIQITASISAENNLILLANEDIRIEANERAHINGEEVEVESFTWTITDSLGNIIGDNFERSREISFRFEGPGKYTISLGIEYPNDIYKEFQKTIRILSQKDFRYPYLGSYQFMRICSVWVETDSLYINSDTTYLSGKIKADVEDISRIQITCGPGDENLVSGFNLTWEENFIAKLLLDNENQHPYFELIMDGPHRYFYGNFINTDSIYIYRYYGSLGHGRTWRYYGSKLN